MAISCPSEGNPGQGCRWHLEHISNPPQPEHLYFLGNRVYICSNVYLTVSIIVLGQKMWTRDRFYHKKIRKIVIGVILFRRKPSYLEHSRDVRQSTRDVASVNIYAVHKEDPDVSLHHAPHKPWTCQTDKHHQNTANFGVLTISQDTNYYSK